MKIVVGKVNVTPLSTPNLEIKAGNLTEGNINLMETDITVANLTITEFSSPDTKIVVGAVKTT